jgi:hypothetical protein
LSIVRYLNQNIFFEKNIYIVEDFHLKNNREKREGEGMKNSQDCIKVLNDLVQAYYEIDSQIKTATPQRELLNRSIKDMMHELNLKVHVANNIVATYKVQSKTSLNREKVVAKLRESGMPDDFLADCWETSEVPTLSVKKL